MENLRKNRGKSQSFLHSRSSIQKYGKDRFFRDKSLIVESTELSCLLSISCKISRLIMYAKSDNRSGNGCCPHPVRIKTDRY